MVAVSDINLNRSIDIPLNADLVGSRVVWGETLQGHARELIAKAKGGPKNKESGNAMDD